MLEEDAVMDWSKGLRLVGTPSDDRGQASCFLSGAFALAGLFINEMSWLLVVITVLVLLTGAYGVYCIIMVRINNSK
jgi:hypothetical protein